MGRWHPRRPLLRQRRPLAPRDFNANGFGVGEKGDKGRASFLAAKSGQKLTVKVNAAAYLNEEPDKYNGRLIKETRLDEKPYWHVERARIDNTRKVPVELIVNGYPVETKTDHC